MATHPRVAATPTHPVDIHQRQEASLLRRVATLLRRVASLKRRVAIPQRRVATPQRRAATLQRRAVTPQQQAVTPQQQAATLLAVTLPQREASPLREGTSLSLVSAVIPPCILSQVAAGEQLRVAMGRQEELSRDSQEVPPRVSRSQITPGLRPPVPRGLPTEAELRLNLMHLPFLKATGVPSRTILGPIH